VQTIGWRQTHLGIGVVCTVTMIPLALLLRRKPPAQPATFQYALRRTQASLGMSPATLQVVLAFAGFCCCVAMSMPQVHIVAYCGDLGYGVTRGAEMLSLMLGLASSAASGPAHRR
jgi:predicted MFS family arabinose efflux permease